MGLPQVTQRASETTRQVFTLQWENLPRRPPHVVINLSASCSGVL
jgi:hypothetical protein